MYWIIVISAVAVAAVGFMVWASADVGSNIYVKSLCRGAGDERVAALTFDDGPDAEMTPEVLAVLRRYGIRATFFLVGEKVDRYPEIVRQIVAEGHTVANHTYSHRGVFPLQNGRRVRQELVRCNDAIARATGLTPRQFRPPFGVTNPIIGRAVEALGLTTIGWSIRSLDTVERRSVERICRTVEANLHNGAIILLHDRCARSAELLDRVIRIATERGYRFVALEEMLKIEDIYENC